MLEMVAKVFRESRISVSLKQICSVGFLCVDDIGLGRKCCSEVQGGGLQLQSWFPRFLEVLESSGIWSEIFYICTGA